MTAQLRRARPALIASGVVVLAALAGCFAVSTAGRDGAVVAQKRGLERLDRQTTIACNLRLNSANDERFGRERSLARGIPNKRERGKWRRLPFARSSRDLCQARPQLRRRMSGPGRDRSLRLRLGIFCDKRASDHDDPQKERRSDRNDGPSDQLSRPCGIIRISVLAFPIFP